MSSFVDTSHLLQLATEAVIDHLSTAGIGQKTAAGTLPMLTAKAKPAKPDRIIAVTAYSAVHEPRLPTTVIRVQLWLRGAPNDPFDADRIGDDTFNDLQDTRHAVWNGLEIVQVEHQSTAQLGPDDTDRYARSDNYTLITQRRRTP